jgi:hypothetical protein
MRFLQLFIAGLVLVIAPGVWLLTSLSGAEKTAAGYCNTTRFGEPLPSAVARAKERGMSFERTSAPGKTPEQHLAVSTFLGRRYGCAVDVVDGRVHATRFGALPKE